MYRAEPVDADDHVFSGPPVAGIDDQVPNGPRLLVDEEVLDVAELAIGRFDAEARHFPSTEQMRTIFRGSARFGDLRREEKLRRERAGAPALRPDPVQGIAVVR